MKLSILPDRFSTENSELTSTACFRFTAARPQVWLALLAAIILYGGNAWAQRQAPPSRPPAVTVTVVQEREINPPRSFVGRVEAVRMVDLRPEVEGILQQQLFKEGSDVTTGDLLYVIEPSRYQAALAAAEASQAKAEATLKEAELRLARNQKLRKDGTVSQAEYDAAVAAAGGATAEVQAAKASVQSAALDLEDTRIVAPIDGRIGRSTVTAGNLVGPSSGPLARIVQLDPIRVVSPSVKTGC
jgi:membrane fusion protein (multidrug efflux system)